MVVENRNTAAFFRLQQTKMFMQEMEIHIKILGAFLPLFCSYLVSLQESVIRLCVTLKFPTKLLIASRNGKGELAFRGSFPSDAFSFMDCPFQA
jgi:hypothetical protein